MKVDRIDIVMEALKKMGLLEALNCIMSESTYKYKVILYGPVYMAFVYKKRKFSMKEDYNFAVDVGDYMVFFQNYKGD